MKRSALLIAALVAFSAIGIFLFQGLGATAYILLLAFVAAYLVYPLILRLERVGISRTLSTLAAFLLVLGTLTLGLFFLIPWLLEELQKLLSQLPNLLESALTRLNAFLTRFDFQVPGTPRSILDWMMEKLSLTEVNPLRPGFDFARMILSQTVSGLLAILNLFLFPVFFFFLIHDYEHILSKARAVIPFRFRPTLLHYLDRVDLILSGFIRGQLTVCLALAILYGIGLSVSNVPFGGVIGLTAGALSFIPYVGAAFGFITSLLVTWGSGGEVGAFIGILVTFGIAQSIESFYLTPKLVGNRVGLSHLSAMLALVVGANWGGFWGMILAIPIAALVQILVIDLFNWYKSSEFYQHS